MNQIETTVSRTEFSDTALKTKREKAKLIIATGFGNFLEIFDFTVFSHFAFIIGVVFFPAENSLVSLMSALAIFGVGFVMRPLGSVIIGVYADHYGRKQAMLVTIAMMAVGSAIIAFTPTPVMIGVAASFFILFGRLLQGFSAGGELGAATTLLLESASAKEKGFFVSWQYIGQGLSTLCGTLFAALLLQFLSEEQLYSWGWRIPFIFALLIVPVGLYIRSHIHETYAHKHHNMRETFWYPIHTIVKHYKKQFCIAILLIVPNTLLIYSMVFYMPNYLKEVYNIDRSSTYYLGAAVSVVMLFCSLIGGFIADYITNRKKIAIILLIVCFISSWSSFYFSNMTFIFIGSLSICVGALGMLMTIQSVMILEAFPRKIRATAGSITYSLGVAIFGGTAQMVITKLLEISDRNPMAPFWYLGPMLVIGIIAYALFQEERHL